MALVEHLKGMSLTEGAKSELESLINFSGNAKGGRHCQKIARNGREVPALSNGSSKVSRGCNDN
ncbi:UNVERIFIED_CONTAM: hypothetical protein Slati_2347800 [Sesamum latifolium]|uniref:Uncharacterized protein n=1 Tax=Sesamum latifolium TaxID=2727402 RepID=A0AAW2WB22_9LAMI